MRRVKSIVLSSIGTLVTCAALAQGSPAARPASASSTARDGDASGSVVLVEDLLRFDNQQTRDALRRASITSALGAPGQAGLPSASTGTGLSSSSRGGPLPVSLQVLAVFGVDDKSSANVLVNGAAKTVQAGAKVGDCTVESVARQCVVLRPTSLKAPARLCPTSCWTGDGAPTLDMQAVGMPAGQGPIPVPIPTLTPAAAGMVQAARPLPLPPSQPSELSVAK